MGYPKKQYWLVVMLCDLCDLCEVILHICYIYIYICWWFSDMLYDFVIGVLYEVATVGFCSILGG